MPVELAHKLEYLPEFSLAIVKASLDKASGEMRWRSVNSDTKEDLYAESMSLELFSDFVRRVDDDLPIPAPFDKVIMEDGWSGGMPYLSVSHYKSAGGKNVPGIVQEIYVDGEKLKSQGIFKDTAMGHAVFKNLLKDLYGDSEYENKIRISIGFLDLQHSHGDFIFTRSKLDDHCPMCAEGVGNKVYLKGQLVHLALTRVPVNPRTEMEVEKMGDTIVTKKKDAESILGDAVALLEEKSGVGDTVSDILTIKADDPKVEEPKVDEPKTETVPVEVAPVKAITVEVIETPFEKSLVALRSKVALIKGLGQVAGNDALKALQAEYDQVGEMLKAEFVVPEAAPVMDAENITAIVTAAVSAAVEPLKAQLAILQASDRPVEIKSKVNKIPQPRSIKLTGKALTATVPGSVSGVIEQKSKSGPRKIKDLAYESTIGTLGQ